MFIDAIHVKIRDGQVTNRPIYVAIGVTVDGERDILGLWIGDGGEGAKYWAHVLTEIKNRGTKDVCILVCDGLTGLPDAVATVWPKAIVQQCVVHMIRASFRYASRRDWPELAKDLKPIYTAATEGGRARAPGRLRRPLGGQVSGHRQAVGERVGGVRSVPQLRSRCASGYLYDERYRVGQRPDQKGGQGPWSFPQRAGGSQVCLPGRHESRHDRKRPSTLVESMEGSTECLKVAFPDRIILATK